MEQDKGRGIRFSPEVRLDTVVVAISLAAAGWGAWSNLTTDVARIKDGQATQVETNNRIEGNIREIKNDVKGLGESVRGVERRMDRARM